MASEHSSSNTGSARIRQITGDMLITDRFVFQSHQIQFIIVFFSKQLTNIMPKQLAALSIGQPRFHFLKLIISVICLIALGQSGSIATKSYETSRRLIAQLSRAQLDNRATNQYFWAENNANFPFISGRSYPPTQYHKNPPPPILQGVDSNQLFPKLAIAQRKLITKRPTVSKPRSEIQISALIKSEFSAYESNQIFSEQLSQAKLWRDLLSEQSSQLSMQEYDYYEKKYNISKYEELPFCIVVPTYNNIQQDRHLRNIRSILQQNYSNYRVVIIDDHSSDGTGEALERFMSGQGKLEATRYKMVRNEKKAHAMGNIRKAGMQYCNGDQALMIVDGDDELIGRQVLKVFNAAFQKEKAWFVYSNFIISKSLTAGYSKPVHSKVVQKNTYRFYPFVTSHLRAYYTQLLRNIREQDLKNENGEYFSSANDVALCMPILQQSHNRVAYLPQITYWYNSDTGQNNHRLRPFQQRQNEHVIRRKGNYQPLGELFQSEP